MNIKKLQIDSKKWLWSLNDSDSKNAWLKSWIVVPNINSGLQAYEKVR